MSRSARPVPATRVLLSAVCLVAAPLAANRNVHVENLSRSRWSLILDSREANLLVYPGGPSGERRLPARVREVRLDPGQRLTLTRPTGKGPEHVTCGLFDAGPLGGLGRSRALYLRFPKEEAKEGRSPVVTLEFRHGVPGWNPCVVEGDTVRILGDGWDPPAKASATVPPQAARGVKRTSAEAIDAPRPLSRPRLAEGKDPQESKEPGQGPAPLAVPGAPASQALRLLTLTNRSDATWTVGFTQEPGPGRQGLWRYKAGRAVQVRPRIEVVLPVAQSYRLPPHAVRFLPMAAGEAPLALRLWDASSRTPRGFVLTADPDAGFTLRHGAGAAEETLIRRTLRIEPGGATLATAAWDPDLGDALEAPPQH
ncbi:hypothetical protein [Geothrix sp. 21YS21S-2]|uniref:hypothetical protein n=1 Tax=Geothrix sp. 21YS21S-2 TaxID=3068893 RepID=UPI0027B93755|nr:hypothetical protein [Geothrix sp. 21YS21S-2]